MNVCCALVLLLLVFCLFKPAARSPASMSLRPISRPDADINALPTDRPLAIKLIYFVWPILRKPSTWSWFLIAVASTLLVLRHQFIADPLPPKESPHVDGAAWWYRLVAYIALIALEKLSIVAAIELCDWWEGKPWRKRSAVLMGLQVLVEIPCYVVPPWLTDDLWSVPNAV